jgi:hypothetical protein
MKLGTPMRRAEREWWATSYHEAAHAAGRIHYELPLVAVTITTNGGLTEGGDPFELDQADDPRLVAEAVTTYAGPLGEAWYLHQTRRLPYRSAVATALRSARGDMGNLDELARHCGWGRRDLRALEDEAVSLVATVWDSIDTIAEALRDHGSLTGDQVYKIA